MSNTIAYRKVTNELRAIREAEAKAARDNVEVVATRGRGVPTIVGRNLREVGEQLTAEGYRMDRCRVFTTPRHHQKLSVPHKDGYKEAIVRVRVKRAV